MLRHEFDIDEYGAAADGATVNTAAIQKAIDTCHEAGGGRVLCGPGTYVTGTIELKSGVELHLMPGCKLVGSTSLSDYDIFQADGFITENSPERSSESLIRAVHAENIAITGPGEINGSGLAFYDTENFAGRFFKKPDTPRPRIVMFYKCKDVRLEGAAFIDSPCWTIWLMKCERVRVHRIRIEGDQRMINNDGIDFDSCRDVTMSDCIIKTGDDCIVLRALGRVYDTPGICENVTITNCVLDSRCQGVRIGCPGDNIVRNCTLTGLVINSENNGIVFNNPKRYLKEDRGGTADVHDIVISNSVINCSGTPIQVFVEEGIGLPRLGGLAFSDMRICSGKPIVVQGSTETIVRDVAFHNVSIETTGEQAILCRNCRDVRLNGVQLSNATSV